MRCKADTAKNRKKKTILLRTLPHTILPFEKNYGGMKMLIAILSLTYMMVIIMIHAIWISSIIKNDGKCHYKNCGHCPYDGWCPMQEDDKHDADRKLHS